MSKPQNSSKFQMVPISELNVDPEAQRSLSTAWVKAQVPRFNVDHLGYIVVNKRANGKLFVVDGQHRVELMRAVGWNDQMIHAELFEGLTQAEEAAVFIERNNKKSVRTFDKFRVRVTAKEPMACDITRIVNASGMLISDQVGNGHIVAVDALERIYKGAGIASPKEGPGALGKALKLTLGAWGHQASSVNGRVIQGIGMMFLKHNGTIDEADFKKKLAPFPGGAPGVLGKGRILQEMRGKPLHHCIASLLTDVYNKGRRDKKLPAWEE